VELAEIAQVVVCRSLNPIEPKLNFARGNNYLNEILRASGRSPLMGCDVLIISIMKETTQQSYTAKILSVKCKIHISFKIKSLNLKLC
jgi:hypothetical protein